MPAEYAQALQPGLEALIRAARQRHARWTGAETAAAATTRASKAKEAEEENASEVRDLVPLLVQATWRLLTPLASALAPEIPTGQLRAVTPMHVLSVLGARQHANQGWHPLRQAALWGAGPIGEAEGVWGPLSLRSAVSVSSSVSLLCHPRVRLPHLSVQLQRLVAAFPFARTADVITMLRCNDSERLRLGAMVSALTEMVRAHAAATGASASSSSSDASSIGSSWKVKRDQAVARVAEAKAAAEAAAKAKEKRKAEKGGDDDDDDEQAAGDEDEEEDAPLIVASAPPVGDLADLSCCSPPRKPTTRCAAISPVSPPRCCGRFRRWSGCGASMSTSLRSARKLLQCGSNRSPLWARSSSRASWLPVPPWLLERRG